MSTVSKNDLNTTGVDRRSILLTAAMMAVGASAAAGLGPTEAAAQHSAGHDMSAIPANWMGNEQIAFLAYPGFTALDLVGPHYMPRSLMGATVHVVGTSRGPITSDMNLTIVPTATFDDCPKELDIICVPGGSDGTLAAMRDNAKLDFLADRGGRAKFVTSVCTGSLVLAAAGLLQGYKATSHWVARDLLRDFGAEPVDQRIVIDRNRVTGAGVTAGIDFGLTLVAKFRDPDYAKAVQLLAEYHPEPPFNAGTPALPGEATTKLMGDMFIPFGKQAKIIAAARK